MINLLSKDIKRQLSSARLNVILRRYVIGTFLTLGLMVGMFGVGLFIIMNERQAAQAKIDANKREAAQYQSVRTSANKFAEDLAAARVILSKEITYSRLIMDIAKVLPPQTVLSSLNIDSATLLKPQTLSARANNEANALVLKEALERSDLFAEVSIITIVKTPLTDTSTPQDRIYPFVITLSAKYTGPGSNTYKAPANSGATAL